MNEFGPVFLGRKLSRRAVLRSTIASAGTLALSTWPAQLGWAGPSLEARKRSLILLWQDGGPSHFETFDPKPGAPVEYRGELDAVPTSLPGVAYCEVLPRLAQLAHRTCVIRSLHQPSSDHVVGSHNVLTGWYGETEGGKSRYPDLASVINRMRSGADEAAIKIGASTDPRLAKGMRGTAAASTAEPSSLPTYIDLSRGLHRGGPAFLGPLYGAFEIDGDPSKPGFVVQNLQSLGSAIRFQDRLQMLGKLDRLGSREGNRSALAPLRAVEGFRRQALELLSGGRAARAFDLSREKPQLRERYGLHLAGQQCLLARRLVEAGAGVVAVRFSPDGRGDYDKTMIGWDDHAVHGNIFAIMRKRGPQFDQAVSALIEDLEQRGRQDVLLVVVGEFGRTPRVHDHKGCPGREHWGPAGCALVYGGDLGMGQVIGSTNDKGERPKERPLGYQDLLATIYHAMGVNPAHTLINHAGRPVPILPVGEPISELVGSPRDGSREKTRALISSARTSTLLDNSRTKRKDEAMLILPTGATGKDLSDYGDLSQLQSLVAHDSSIDDDGLAALACARQLKCLQLNGAPVTDAGLIHLAHLTALHELNLTGTLVTDGGLVHLKSLTRLKRITFNGTSVSLSGIVRLIARDQQRTLGDALAAMGLARFDDEGKIVEIDVAATSFGDEEMQYLSQLPSLRSLHLAATRVTDAGMVHVQHLPQLEELYLAKCAVGDDGLSHVADLSRLQAINLYGTQITSTGLAHLSGLDSLRLLMITDVKLSAAVVEELKNKLPHLTVTDFAPA